MGWAKPEKNEDCMKYGLKILVKLCSEIIGMEMHIMDLLCKQTLPWWKQEQMLSIPLLLKLSVCLTGMYSIKVLVISKLVISIYCPRILTKLLLFYPRLFVWLYDKICFRERKKNVYLYWFLCSPGWLNKLLNRLKNI